MEEYYSYWMDNLDKLTNNDKIKLIQVYGSCEKIFNSSLQELRNIFGYKISDLIDKHKYKFEILKEESDKYKLKGMKLARYGDFLYYRRLLNISAPPFVYYYYGKELNEKRPAISIVGARICSNYGKDIARIIGGTLGDVGIPTVSGMALGIDSISQRETLSHGGYSLGVLGNGVDICYPKDSLDLYKSLKENGCILSEYKPNINPMPNLFPRRNRIISGLSNGVIIVEARLKSGTLTTAEHALNQGKDVYVIPGRINDPLSRGCNKLISEGANIITDIDLFLEEFITDYQIKNTSYKNKLEQNMKENSIYKYNLSTLEKEVLSFIDSKPINASQISLNSNKEISEVKTSLISLLIKGIIKEKGTGWYTLA